MNIGFGNMVNTDKIVSIISSDSAPAKRMISRGKEQEILIDATQGRRTKSVIFTENNKIILFLNRKSFNWGDPFDRFPLLIVIDAFKRTLANVLRNTDYFELCVNA